MSRRGAYKFESLCAVAMMVVAHSSVLLIFRWYGASLLEMLRIEYKNPLLDYYDRLIAAGCVQVQPARSSSKRITDPAIVLQHVVQPNDLVCLTMHRHEPPVAATQIEILHHGRASGEPAPADENAASMEVDVEASSSAETIVVNKPGGIPVHASGRYFSNTIVGILKSEHDIDAIRQY
jgi:23S rRNA-/tRNA-specific pseudouridylate synthase